MEPVLPAYKPLLADRLKEHTTWYYVRVVQSMGSLAWSSPIWVNKKEK